jgi:hypothetical protein
VLPNAAQDRFWGDAECFGPQEQLGDVDAALAVSAGSTTVFDDGDALGSDQS